MALPATEDFTGAAAALGAGYQQTAMPTSVGRTLDKDGSGHGTVSATGSDTFAYDTANTYNDDQYSQEVINSITGGSPEPIIRASGSGNTGSGYFTYYTGAAIGIGKYVGGAFTDKGSSAGSYTAGDLVRIEATGTNLTVTKNGTSATTATDSGLTSGAAGPGLDGSSPILIDDWEGGNMVTASTGGWASAGTRQVAGRRGPFDRRGFLYQRQYDYTPSRIGTIYSQSVDGGLTPVGTLSLLTSRALTGGFTPAGTLTKQTARALTGGFTPSATLTKQANKVLTGGMTPSATLSGLKVALLSVAGAITPSGTLIKSTGKVLTAGSTPSATVTKSTGKILAASVDSSGTLTKQTNKPLSGGVTPSGVLAAGRLLAQALVGAIAVISGSLTTELNPEGGVVVRAAQWLRDLRRPNRKRFL